MNPASISQTFTQRPLDDEQVSLLELANLRFSQIEEALGKPPASRLKAIALTELEKTSLVVNKAISRKNDAA